VFQEGICFGNREFNRTEHRNKQTHNNNNEEAAPNQKIRHPKDRLSRSLGVNRERFSKRFPKIFLPFLSPSSPRNFRGASQQSDES